MDKTALVIAVVTSWVASVLAFPTLPFQHWLNSRLRTAWKTVTFRPTGLTGRWLATYDMPRKDGGSDRRYEIIQCSHLVGGEVRGKIRDEGTDATYNFLGRIVFDEFVAHYWSTDESRDIGNFKLLINPQTKVLIGSLTVWDSFAGTTKPGIEYVWRSYPTAFAQMCKKSRVGWSEINGTGVFATIRFEQNEEIGVIALGCEQNQGQHTIKFGGKDRKVEKPWRFLNHSCEPNSRLDWQADRIVIMANREVLPQTELTIDYNLLPEKIGTPFDCRCPKCVRESHKVRIGG